MPAQRRHSRASGNPLSCWRRAHLRAASAPVGVIPAHAGIQWRGVRFEARRSLRIAVRSADRVSSGLRPAEQGGLCVPKAPLASPKGHPGKSPRALPVRAVPGKRRPREGRQTTRASMPSNSLAIPLARASFPGDFQGPRSANPPSMAGWRGYFALKRRRRLTRVLMRFATGSRRAPG